ncbi:hypothetical protein [Bradyrhizobium sp. DASA03007]|uniref:hypothetical protein n=1 Tax=unclassified Bradyrhizobium TaxID=2631580 RepID=UPI003F72617C
MSGHSVSNAVGVRAVLSGKLTADYGGTRVYELDGDHYFIPEQIWKAIENEAAKRPGQGP